MKTGNRIGIILLLLLLIYNPEIYPQYVFRHLDIADGLSDNQIRNITLAPDGRMAVRTMTLLNIYNGATFEPIYQDRRKDYKWNFNRFLKERYVFKDYCDINGRIWMKAPDYLSLFDLNNNRFVYDIAGELKSFGIDRKIKNMFIDDSKNYWFLTEDNTFLLYDISKKELVTVDDGGDAFVQQYGIPYELAQYKNLYWIMYSGGLLRCWDSSSREFIMQDTSFTGKISDASNFLCIHPTATGDLWLMYNNAVSFYNRTDRTWKEIATIKGSSNFFTCLDLDKDGNAWVGTSWSGLRKIDAQTYEVEIISGLKLNNGGILENDIECVFVDDDNGLWVGTLWQGICYYHPSMKKFNLIQTIQKETLITNESIRCFLEDDDGTILLGTLYEGVLRYDPATKKISKAFKGFLSEGLILSLYRDSKKRLWAGTFLDGFYCIDGKDIKIYNRSAFRDKDFTNQNMSRAIYEDGNGRYWVSVANQGVGELDIQTGKITMLRDKHPEIGFHRKNFGFYFVNDHTFATFGESGIYYYDTQKDKIFIPEIGDPDSPKFASPNISYNCVMKDSRSLEWFGTEQGIRIWDEENKTAYVIDTKVGLSNNYIESMKEDDDGAVWVASANSITKIEIEEKGKDGYEFALVNFDTQDGLQNGKFFEQSSLKAKNGDLYFGGYNGFNTFNPSKIDYNQSKKKPVFTSLRLFNLLIDENTDYKGRKILEKPINNTREIKLNYTENFVTLEFSGLNYVNPSRTYYRYKLENYDQNWNEIQTNGSRIASYTGLPPGKYKLVVYTANNDKVWSDEPAELSVVITPPLWATGYAYIFYFLLFAVVLFFVWRLIQKRLKEKRSKQETLEREKQKEEFDQMKFRFFTNISHEFRTPLTLIMTPLNRLINQLADENLKQKLSSVYKNAEDMMGLINQLLDFRKLEMGGEKLKITYDDFVKFAEYVYLTFEDIAANKSIQFTFESDIKYLYMGFDKNKVHKILNNLYSNALKFTPEKGYITTIIRLRQEEGRQFVNLDVADSGCGIPDSEQQMIFTRFYQSENNDPDKTGSGIGLHLVKEYIGLHEGRISLCSKVGEGSLFSVFIPTDLQVTDNNTVDTVETLRATSPHNISKSDEGQKTLLIVEDNAELRRFLAEQLNDKFNVLQAADGKEGLSLAQKKSPDLIISDLMMPGLNGLEMCQRLKNDIQTSHISIILLTAKLSDETEIESYKAGADSYVAKPFNFEVLLTRIETLIEQQEKRRKRFRKTIEITPGNITATSLDEELVEKALSIVEKNIDNSEYSVDELASKLALSRRQLSRKFQAVIGLSPGEFIRSVRLKRAAQLLKDTQYNISEIAYMVGFSAVKYFNLNFKDEFGVTPTQYRSDRVNESALR